MKTLLALILVLGVGIGIAYLVNPHLDEDGATLASRAASTYCSMVRMQRTSNVNKALKEEQLEHLKLEHNSLMRRSYALRGEERTVFSSTYSSIVDNCK